MNTFVQVGVQIVISLVVLVVGLAVLEAIKRRTRFDPVTDLSNFLAPPAGGSS